MMVTTFFIDIFDCVSKIFYSFSRSLCIFSEENLEKRQSLALYLLPFLFKNVKVGFTVATKYISMAFVTFLTVISYCFFTFLIN